MEGNKLTLLKLLIEADDYLSYETLAESLAVSTRTIIRLVKDIQAYIATFHVEIELKKRKGIRLVGDIEDLKRLKEVCDTSATSIFTSSERMIFIMIELFDHPEYTKIYYLAYTLQVSITTIQHDLSAIENYLRLNHVSLLNQRGQGVKIHGNQKDVLWAIAGFISPYIEWKEEGISYNYLLSAVIQKKMEEFFSLVKLTQIKNIVDSFDYTLSQVFVLEDYHHFLILNCIMIHYQTYFLSYPDAVYDEEIVHHQIHYRYHEFIKKIKREGLPELSQSLGNLYTCAYLVMRKLDTQMDSYQYDEELYYLTLRFLADVEQELQVSLNRDANLIDRLALHMKLVINRIKMGTVINNTYIEEVKKKYANVFAAVKHHLYLIENRYALHINENEIGYITIHVLATMIEQENRTRHLKAAVLCMSGMGTSKMLIETIRQRYPMMDIACTLSMEDFNEFRLLQEGYDVLISTIAVDTMTLPCVMVHPIMKELDFKNLNQLYEQLLTKRSFVEEAYVTQNVEIHPAKTITKQMMLHRLQICYRIVEQFSVCECACSSFDELVTCIAAQEIQPDMREEFIHKIYVREQLGSTIINAMNFMLIHCRLQNEICLKLYRMETSFPYLQENEEQKIQYAFVMIAPQEDDESVLEVMSQISMAVAMDETFQQTLCNGNENEILSYLIQPMMQHV